MLNQNGFLTVPLAIIIAGIIIGVSVIYAIGQNKAPSPSLEVEDIDLTTSSLDSVRPIGADDHILGNIDAPVKIIEYSDPECPFCKRFHTTMKQTVKSYGDQVAWIYRHFPLDSLHSQAREESIAIECAGLIGGNVKFWSYLDRLMEITPSNDGLDLDELSKIATHAGIDLGKFSTCRKSKDAIERVEKDYQNAIESGGQGTPFSVVIGSDGSKYPVEGAYPLNEVKKIIDGALKIK